MRARIFEVFETSATVDEIVAGTGAIVMGRRTYEVEDRDRQGVYGGMWAGSVFVVRHDPPAKAPEWMTGTFVEGVEERGGAGEGRVRGPKVGLLGASVARQCLAAGLLDEVVVQVAPVLLGDGGRMLASGAQTIKLEKTTVAESGQLTDTVSRGQMNSRRSPTRRPSGASGRCPAAPSG